MIDEAIILAAGKGTRIRSLADNLPKALIPFYNNKTIIDIILDKLYSFGIRKVKLVVGYSKNHFIKYLKKVKNIKIEFIYNKNWEKENGISAYLGLKTMENKISLMLMSDHIFGKKILENLKIINPVSGYSYLLVDKNIDKVFDISDATKVLADTEGNLINIGKNIKKYNAVDTGIFVMHRNIISEFYKNIKQGKNTISDTVLSWARKDNFKVIEMKQGYWQDIDTEIAYYEAKKNVDKIIG